MNQTKSMPHPVVGMRVVSNVKGVKHDKQDLSKFIYIFTFMFLFIFGTGKLQAQNNVNLLPDSGNVGIGTATPVEKFEVNGNAKIHGKVKMTDSLNVDGSIEVMQSLSVADSMSVGSTLSVEEDLTVGVDLVVGSDVDVSKNLFVADSLIVGTALKVPVITDVESITTNNLVVNTITGNSGSLTLGIGNNTDPNCTALQVNYCNRRLYGYRMLPDQSVEYRGVGIGVSAIGYGYHSFAAGENCFASGEAAVAIGSGVRSFGDKSIIIGSASPLFSNNKENSLMVGFNLATGSNPSLYVGPSSGTMPGNVGIGTADPFDKFQIGEGMESITFGSAVNDDAGWISGYLSFNARRVRTGIWQSSVWNIDGDQENNGAFILESVANGTVHFIPIITTDGQSYSLSDAEIKARRMITITPGVYNSQNSALEGGEMKINGNVICRDLEVTLTGWWDDVFKPGYKLMSIEELELYIALNGHLPGIPTEEEVVGETMSVQEMNLMLLQKVEELSLYIIDLQNQINELKNEQD